MTSNIFQLNYYPSPFHYPFSVSTIVGVCVCVIHICCSCHCHCNLLIQSKISCVYPLLILLSEFLPFPFYSLSFYSNFSSGRPFQNHANPCNLFCSKSVKCQLVWFVSMWFCVFQQQLIVHFQHISIMKISVCICLFRVIFVT